MKVLITGAYGFVGTNLCQFLTNKGHQCYAVDIARGNAPYKAYFNWEQLNDIPWNDLDAVVHLAGKAHDVHNTSAAQSYFDINVRLTEKIFNVAKDKVPRFIFFSSVKACADQVEGILTEEETCTPVTPYGQSKLKAEEFLRGQKSTTQCYILRPAMIHGPGNKGNLNLLYGVVRHGLPWPLGAFENQRSLTSIDNICAVVESLCSSNFSSNIFQVADDESLSVNDIIKLIGQSIHKKIRLWHLSAKVMTGFARIGDALHLPLNSERLKKLTESYVVSNKKIKEALGWSHMPISAEDGMRKTLESFAKK